MVPRLQPTLIMRGRIIGALGALAMLAGCPGDDVPPGQPDGAPVDTVVGDNSLSITFIADQDVPGMTAADRTLDDVRLHADTVRAIGDAAPGDSRTTEDDYELRWHESTHPDTIGFDRAPAGVYSTVEVRIEEGGGDEHGILIEGEAQIEEAWVPYRIEAEEGLTIAIATTTTLPVGGSETIEIQVDLARMIAAIDFSAHPIVEGRIEIDGEDPAIRTAIREAFSAVAQD
jgi:hypothetical protein